MSRNEKLRAEEIKRRQNPDDSHKHHDPADEDKSIKEERKKGERGTEHDKENMEREPE